MEGSLAWAPTLDRRPVNRREVVHARHDRPTFYRSPADAIAALLERLAYVEAFDPAGRAKDAMTVLDRDPSSLDDGQAVGWSELASSPADGWVLGAREPGSRPACPRNKPGRRTRCTPRRLHPQP